MAYLVLADADRDKALVDAIEAARRRAAALTHQTGRYEVQVRESSMTVHASDLEAALTIEVP